MKKLFAFLLALLLTASVFTAAADGMWAAPAQPIAARSGPSADYDDLGVYLSDTWQNTRVYALAKSGTGDAWWLQVEFTENARRYRGYTEARNVNVDVSFIPEETMLGQGAMSAAGDVHGYYGPGQSYPQMENVVPWCVDVTVWGAENGYLLVDFFDEELGIQRRSWVFAGLAEIEWLNDKIPAGAIPVNNAEIKEGDVFKDEEENVSCTVVQYGRMYDYTVLSLDLYGQVSYPLFIVAMKSSDYGTFRTPAGGTGEAWFESDHIQLLFDEPLPVPGMEEYMTLYRSKI